MDIFRAVVGHGNESAAQKQVKSLLLDDDVRVLSSFEMNQIASLTYGDLVCDEIFEIFETVVAQPMSFSVLTVQKTLVVMKHVLIYGSEKCVNSAYGIGKFVESLKEFNTVLLTQQQGNVMSILQQMKGGGVDKGGPVREAAVEVDRLLSNINQLQAKRLQSADPNSLVPIGHTNKVAFVTDDVRLYFLKKRMEEQQRITIQSNLAKADGGFGGGYKSRDGKTVVGAAHGIEEMIKIAAREKQKYSDSASETPQQIEAKYAEMLRDIQPPPPPQPSVDLLGSETTTGPHNNNNNTDLLDFGATTTTTTTTSGAPQDNFTGDLLGGFSETTPAPSTSAQSDLLGFGGTPSAGLGSSKDNNNNNTNSLLGDPFAASQSNYSSSSMVGGHGADLLNSMASTVTNNTSPTDGADLLSLSMAGATTTTTSMGGGDLNSALTLYGDRALVPAVDPKYRNDNIFATASHDPFSNLNNNDLGNASGSSTNNNTTSGVGYNNYVGGSTNTGGMPPTMSDPYATSSSSFNSVNNNNNITDTPMGGLSSMVAGMTVSDPYMPSGQVSSDTNKYYNNHQQQQQQQQQPPEDRFAALDALVPKQQNSGSILAAVSAENRILGHTAPSNTNGNNNNYNYQTATVTSTTTPLSTAMPGNTTAAPPPMDVPPPPPPPPTTTAPTYNEPLGSGAVVGTYYGDSSTLNNQDDEDNPWIMGGTVGSGLKPLGAAPAAPPPPPPE